MSRDDWQIQREACWHEFQQAVADALLGDFASCKRLVDRCRDRFGEEVAERQRRELWAYIRARQK